MTALHIAVKCGHDKLVELLIQNGADVFAIAEEGFTAMHIACQEGMMSCAQALITAAGDRQSFVWNIIFYMTNLFNLFKI